MAAARDVVFGDNDEKKEKGEEIKPQGCPTDSGGSVFCLTCAQQGKVKILWVGGTE